MVKRYTHLSPGHFHAAVERLVSEASRGARGGQELARNYPDAQVRTPRHLRWRRRGRANPAQVWWCREGESNPHGLAPTRF